MGLPVLSEDGKLSFPDAESLVEVCNRLQQQGQFEALYMGTAPPGLVRLRIHVPDGRPPIVHTAALRPLAGGQVAVGLRRAAGVTERLQSAIATLKCPAGTATPPPCGGKSTGPPTGRQRPTTPIPGSQVAAKRSTPPPPATGRGRLATPPITGSHVALRRDSLMRGDIVRPSRVQDLGALFGDPAAPAELASTNLAALIRFLGANRSSGRLRLQGPCTKTFWILDGQLGPSKASPPAPQECLGQLAVKLVRTASLDSVERAAEQAREQGRLTGEVLVEQGVLKPHQVLQLLGAQSEARLLEAANWAAARYEFSPCHSDTAKPLLGNLRARVSLARQLVGQATSLELQTRFGDLEARYGRVSVLPEIEERALLGDERAATELRSAFPGTSRLQDALHGSTLGRVTSMRMLVLLDAYGALETSPDVLASSKAANPREAVRHRLAQARDQDPFRRLGVHPATHLEEIREAHTRLLAECRPGGSWEAAAPEFATQLANLIDESFLVLREEAARKRLRRGVLGEDRARFVADLLVAQARELIASGDRERGRLMAEVAAELADHPEAAALLAGE